MTGSGRVVIVGASIAGRSTAEALRDEGFDGEIVIVGDEPHPPYLRPPLSKQVLLGEGAAAATSLAAGDELGRRGIRVRAGESAIGLDVGRREVHLGTGPLAFDTLVIATGARPVQGVATRGGDVHQLRTLDDAVRLCADLERASRVVVVGAGVLGSEVASAARKRGKEVTLVGRSPRLTLGEAGGMLSDLLEQLHRSQGVQLKLGRTALGVAPGGSGVLLSDGETLAADLVVEAIGAAPAVDWLSGSGLDLSDGVVCDRAGRAAPGIYAVGDVAAWYDPRLGRATRIEHQLAAIERAQGVARNIATGEVPTPTTPFFWTELYGVRIQSAGWFRGSSLDISEGDPSTGRFVVAATAGGSVTGVIGWNHPRPFARARSSLLADPVRPAA